MSLIKFHSNFYYNGGILETLQIAFKYGKTLKVKVNETEKLGNGFSLSLLYLKKYPKDKETTEDVLLIWLLEPQTNQNC